MSGQIITYEGMMALFMEDREQMREIRESIREDKEQMRQIRESAREDKEQMRQISEQIKETDRIARRTSREVGKFTGSMGRVIEHMVAGDNIVKQFQDLGYEIYTYSRNKKFAHGSLDAKGEIDLFLEDGDVAILIEVKTTLETKDVRKHMLTLDKFRRVADTKGDKRRFIGAVAGAVIEGDAKEVAHENGMYVIVQSGKAVEIVPTPEGFQAKQW